MLGQWRLTLRKAEHALKEGLLDRACRYVTYPEVRSYRQARELAGRVVEALAQRAGEYLRQGDSPRAWNDLAQAEKLDASHQSVNAVRLELVKRAIEEAVGYLRSGQPEPVVECMERLTRRGVGAEEPRRLHEAAVAWRAGRELTRAGRFAQASEQLAVARGLIPECEPLEAAVQEAWAGRERMEELEPQLHRAWAAEDWTAALAAADEILGLAPEHAQARAARRGAWHAVGAPASVGPRGGRAVMGNLQNGQGGARTVIRPPGSPLIDASHPRPLSPQTGRSEFDEQAHSANDERCADPNTGTGQRFLLWIDGVGGYLVCLGDRVSIGQPAGWHVDVPIMADLSRLHAWIERDGEGYLLRAVRPAAVNGHSVREKSVLADESEIVLGGGVRLKFRRPSPLSTSARLELASAHRLSLPTEAVLLMAETLIVGPKTGSHVVAPGWTREVVVFRQGEELWCRTAGGFEVDGQPCHDRARVTLSSRVRGEGFSLALEPLDS